MYAEVRIRKLINGGNKTNKRGNRTTMTKVLKIDFELGQLVYLKTDTDQLPRIVTAIIVKPNLLVYELSQSDKTSDHYAFEISSERSYA